MDLILGTVVLLTAYIMHGKDSKSLSVLGLSPEFIKIVMIIGNVS